MKLLRLLGLSVLTLLVFLSAIWATFALWYQLPFGLVGRAVGAILFATFAVVVIALLWRRRAARAVLSYSVALLVLLGWWNQIKPSDTRDWADDVSRHLQWQLNGDILTITNVRNFEWRSDTDYTERWETRSYDLRKLKSLDMAASYWMGPVIAHTLVSFGFDDGQGKQDQLAFSIEIRKERNEKFSAIAGFFKKFELSLIAADERDILRVRTNVRNEDVYLYRVAMKPEQIRALLMAYLGEADLLRREPQFYNTLTANCTTIIYEMAKRIVDGLPLDWRLLASGYMPEYLRDVGGLAGLAPEHDLNDLRAKGRITLRALAANADPEFSSRIRQGIPGIADKPSASK